MKPPKSRLPENYCLQRWMLDPALDSGLQDPRLSGNGGFLTLRVKHPKNTGRKKTMGPFGKVVCGVLNATPDSSICCVTLGMLSSLSVPHFPHL